MTSIRPVLILAGTARVVQAIARCLAPHGISVDVAFAAGLVPNVGFHSAAVQNVFSLPGFDAQEELSAALIALVEKNGYDTIFPTTDEWLVAVMPVYEDL